MNPFQDLETLDDVHDAMDAIYEFYDAACLRIKARDALALYTEKLAEGSRVEKFVGEDGRVVVWYLPAHSEHWLWTTRGDSWCVSDAPPDVYRLGMPEGWALPWHTPVWHRTDCPGVLAGGLWPLCVYAAPDPQAFPIARCCEGKVTP